VGVCRWRPDLHDLLKRYRKRLNELGASFQTSSKAPDATTLLAGFIAGTPPHNAWVAFNIDIILLLLDYFGEQLGSNVLDRVTPERLQEIQDAIAATGSRLDLARLVSSHPPDHIPTHAVYPGGPKQPAGWAFSIALPSAPRRQLAMVAARRCRRACPRRARRPAQLVCRRARANDRARAVLQLEASRRRSSSSSPASRPGSCSSVSSILPARLSR
jgi:hypothetical protein